MTPLDVACLHFATDQELARDSGYLHCTAKAGEPCTWARRSDGVTDPPFHSERLEALALPTSDGPAPTEAQFDAAVLALGEV